MPLSILDWHNRFLEQARWTEDLRAFLFQKAGIGSARHVLEVGCGTGAVLSAVSGIPARNVYGADQDSGRLHFARSVLPAANLVQADALSLPFPARSFDILFSHFFFLWVHEPEAAVREIFRVLRPGGAALALAEPDYGSRIDFPEPLDDLGRLQRDSLIRQGADADIGRRIGALFAENGLRVALTGILGGQWNWPGGEDAGNSEWEILRNDLKGMLPPEKIGEFAKADRAARNSGARVAFIPTFYCLGFRDM